MKEVPSGLKYTDDARVYCVPVKSARTKADLLNAIKAEMEFRQVVEE